MMMIIAIGLTVRRSEMTSPNAADAIAHEITGAMSLNNLYADATRLSDASLTCAWGR